MGSIYAQATPTALNDIDFSTFDFSNFDLSSLDIPAATPVQADTTTQPA